MNKQQFLQRFSFQNLDDIDSNYRYQGETKQASVLIPLIETDDGIQVLLTKRAKHLKHHPGQISFPGGKVEEIDSSLVATALREAEEEIGLSGTAVDIVGQLKEYHTISGYLVTPIIGFIPKDYPFNADQNEVAEIFNVPFNHFIDESNHLGVEVSRGGSTHNVYFMPYLQYNIWGATAAIMKDLIAHLK